MKIKDKDGWEEGRKNNEDGYGKAIYDYAERWANLMEEKIANGEKIKDIAQATSCEADTEGITGFMYGAAVSVLSQTWEHGEELRQWSNIDLQIGDEGEKANEEGTVLNPALINIV